MDSIRIDNNATEQGVLPSGNEIDMEQGNKEDQKRDDIGKLVAR